MLSDAKRSVLWSGIQHVSIYGLQLLITLFIARLISPEDYGIIAMTVVFFSIAQAVIDFGMEGALIQRKHCSSEDYNTAFWFSLGMSIALYVLFFFTAGSIAEYFNIPQLEKVIRISAIVLVIRAMGIVPYSILQRNLNFKSIAKIAAIVTIISGATAIYMAYMNYAYWALVVQTLMSALLMTILYFAVSGWMPSFRLSRKSLRELLGFGLPMMLTSLVNSVYSNLYSLVIGKRFSDRQLGLYNRGTTFAGYVPYNLSDFSLRALYPIFSKYQDNHLLLRTQALRTLKLTVFVAVPINLFILANVRDIVLIVLKDKWLDIVPIIRILCVAHLSYLVCNIHIVLLKTINRTDRLLWCEIIKKVIGIAILAFTLPMGIIPMMWGLLAFNAINIIVGTFFVRRSVGITLWDQIKSGLPLTVMAAGSVAAGYFAASPIGNIYARVCVSGIISIAVYMGVCLLLKEQALKFFWNYLRRK